MIAVTNGTGNNLTSSIVTALIQSILGSPATGLAKGNTTNISTQLNGDVPFNSITAPDANNNVGSNPKAYMTIVFFDERFNYVAENSMALRVSQQGNGAAPLVLANVKAPKNGFAYIYLSNESAEPVYFDDFTVADTRGRIIEEDHYYAFGLKIAGISSKKLGDVNEGLLDNKNLYNDKELFEDADLGWYDYGYRNYDAQIGRFPQLDPLTDDYPELTNYQYAGNDPIANIDLDGLEKLPTVGGWWNGSFLEQGGKVAGAGAGKLLTSATIQVAKQAGKVAEHKVADALINKALQGGAKQLIKQFFKKAVTWGIESGSKISLVTYFTLKPIETGQELTPHQLYRFMGLHDPKSDPDPQDKQEPLYLYRFDTRSPSEILSEGGFKAWGLNFSIQDHVSGKSINDKTSAYVSTSRTREGALDLWKGRRTGYLYKIKYQLTGIDVSSFSKFLHQNEIAVPLIIFPSDIVRVEKLLKSK